MRIFWSVIITIVLFGCTSGKLEITTSESLNVYALPKPPEVPGNHVVGVIPPQQKIIVEDEIYGKDFAVYKVEYHDKLSGKTVVGYVLHGSKGMAVNTIKPGYRD
jgi:hypothetical protein